MSRPRSKPNSPLSLEGSIGAAACALAFLVPFLPDERLTRLKLEGLELGILLLATLTGIRFIWDWPRTIIKKNHLAVFSWLAVNIFFWAISSEKSLATPELRRVLLASGAYLAFSLSGLSDIWKRRFFLSWFGAGSLISLYGILQFFGGIGPLLVPQMDRVMSTYGNPIFFAAYLVPSIFITIELLNSKEILFPKILLIAGLASQILALILTQTRAAWLAMIVTFGFASLWRSGFRKLPNWAILLMVLGVGVFINRTHSIWTRDQGHLLIWRDTLRMWKDHPLTGVGPGAFHTNFQSYAQADLKSKWPQGQFIVNEAHNEYLQTLSETGLAGLAAFFSTLLSFFWRRTDWSWPVWGIAAMLVQAFFSVDMRFGISLANCFMLMGISDAAAPEEIEAATPGAPKIGLSAAWVLFLLIFILPLLLRPYRAQREIASAPGFFDQRLLDPAKSIADMEALKAQYPLEPAVIEKLAYVYAKEIMGPDKKINVVMAEKAAGAYRDLIKIDPKRVAAYNNLANIYYTTGRTEDALAAWREAIAVDPNFIDAHLNLGKILYVQGKLKESAQHFESVLKIDPNNADAIVYLKKMVE